jgi:hypothetical protein
MHLEAKAYPPSSTLVLQGVHTSQDKQKKEKVLPLEICEVIPNTKFMVVCKKKFMKHGGQSIK